MQRIQSLSVASTFNYLDNSMFLSTIQTSCFFECASDAWVLKANFIFRLSSGGATAPISGPPPPPIHRYPSWEDRIYQVASEGMKDATGGDQIDSKNNNATSESDLKGNYGVDVNVPVYATVKGVRMALRTI